MFTKKLMLSAILTAVLFSAFTMNTLGATKTVTANGNAQVDTAYSKFGGASGLFDGNSDFLNTADSTDWYFGTGEFTIDFWIRFNALPATGAFTTIISQRPTGASAIYSEVDFWNSGGTIYFRYAHRPSGGAENIVIKNAITLSTNTWYHLAVARSGNSWYQFKDGTQIGTTSSNTNSVTDIAAALNIGRNDFSSEPRYFNGWLDEFRVSKGIARWTSTFIPPSNPYVGDSNTVLLLHCDGADSSTTFTDASTITTPDFTISSSKSTMSINPGSSDASTITVTSILNFSQDVTLSSSWTGTTPSGVAVTIDPTSVTPTSGGATSTMTVNVDTFSSTGTYSLQVTGTAGSISHSTTISLTISATPGTHNFRVRAGATKITVTCTWANSGTIIVQMVSPPSTTYNEPDMAIYEKTTIVAGSTPSYNYLKRAQLAITAPSSDQMWMLRLTTSVTTYTVDIEVT